MREQGRDDLEEIAFSAGIWEAGRFEEQLLTLMYEADASDPRAASLLTSRASWTTSWEGSAQRSGLGVASLLRRLSCTRSKIHQLQGWSRFELHKRSTGSSGRMPGT
ncbi:unnamed protein product [Symbiodinium microadriaticum]|nr:unnamed protein product [Symbiodinium microadriaticum]CAE7934101.1 unnamed protein product [Symbiodinium sp. KB8]